MKIPWNLVYVLCDKMVQVMVRVVDIALHCIMEIDKKKIVFGGFVLGWLEV